MMIASPKEWFSVSDATFNEKALYIAVLLTFFCLPLGTAPPTIAGALSVAIWLFSGIAIAKRRVYRSTYWMPVYAMAILPLIGMIYTHDKYGLSVDYGGKAYYWLFALVVAAISFRRLPALRLVQAFMLGLAINVFAAMAQIIFNLQDRYDQHRGLGPDYSTLSAYLIIGIMMTVFFLNRSQQRTPTTVALWGLLGLYFFHLVILRSRASYVAFVLLIPFIGMTYFKTRKLLKTATICLLVPALMMLSPVVRERIKKTMHELTYHVEADAGAAWGNQYTKKQDRFYMWNGALRIIRDHPLIGVGTGGYKTALKEKDPDPNIPPQSHPHNNFLHIGVSYGLFGLAIFCWFIISVISRSWRSRAAPEGYFLLSVILVMLITGLFNTQFLDLGTALLISLAVGLQQAFEDSAYD